MLFRKKKYLDKEITAMAADCICDALSSSQLIHADINGHGISEMAIEWNGHKIELSWYGRWQPRSLSIDGNRCFPKGRHSQRIFEAAWRRADQLTDEMLNNLMRDESSRPQGTGEDG